MHAVRRAARRRKGECSTRSAPWILWNLRAGRTADVHATQRKDATAPHLVVCRSDARADGERRRGVPGAARPGPPPRQSQVPRQRQRNVTEASPPPRDLGSIDEGQGASILCCARACAHGTRSSRFSRSTQQGSTSRATVKLQRKCGSL